jgi:IclR family acetate operon transcriptional repressor
MAILEVLGASDHGCKLTEIARSSGLSPSTTHRLLTTLEKRRYIQFDVFDGRWHIGLRLMTIGAAFLRRSSFVAPAQPFMRQLRDQTKETVNLGLADDGELVVVSQVPSRQIVRAISRVGGRVPMTSSAMGKAILSTYSPEDIGALVKLHGMRRQTAASITSSMDLREELDVIRARGYAVDNEEYSRDVRCIAAVVYGGNAEALCAISVSGLVKRLPPERVAQFGLLVSDAAAQITASLGGKSPPTTR